MRVLLVSIWLLLISIANAAAATTTQASTAASVDGYPIGWCIRAKPEAFTQAKSAGFEYVELAMQDVYRLSDSDFDDLRRQLGSRDLRVRAGYNPIPKDLKLVGPDVDAAKLDEHVTRLLDRAAALKLKYLILNAGPAWRVPDGLDAEEAFAQLTEFTRRFASDAASRGDITVLVPPVRSSDSNQITTIGDALKLIDAVGRDNCALMVDYSFLIMQNDNFSALLKSPTALRHVHLSNPSNKRTYPMTDDESDYRAFFRVLKQIHYRGGLSVHGSTSDFDADAPRAIAFLRSKARALTGRDDTPTTATTVASTAATTKKTAATTTASTRPSLLFRSVADMLATVPKDVIPDSPTGWTEANIEEINRALAAKVLNERATLRLKIARIERTGEGRYQGIWRIVSDHPPTRSLSPIIFVYCPDELQQDLARLRRGQSVTIRGKITHAGVERPEGGDRQPVRLVINLFEPVIVR